MSPGLPNCSRGDLTPIEPPPGEVTRPTVTAVEGGPAGAPAPWVRFLTGPGLPVFLLTTLAAYEGFLLVTILGPTDNSWLGDFVRDFQRWCYQGDPRTGGISWNAVAIMMAEPAFVVGLAALLWRSGVARLPAPGPWRQHRGAVGAGLAFTAVAVAGLVGYARWDAAQAAELPPFPGERIRVQLALPEAVLADQRGESFRFAELRGRVVLVTGIYAACTTSCPEILRELEAVAAELTPAERAGLDVVALSLNPEYETTELMGAWSEARGLRHPAFRYVNGRDPAAMHELLTQLQFAAVRDPATGVVGHANLFLLVDRANHIAYRFTLEPRHRAWLRAALRSLLAEPDAGPPPAS
jgi:protein SCO1/2